MSTSLRISIDATTRDLSRSAGSGDCGCSAGPACLADRSPTIHDYVDTTPRTLDTDGVPGSAFVNWQTSVAHIERAFGMLPTSADVWLRWGGAAAEVLSSLTAPSGGLNGLTLTLNVDDVGEIETTFVTGDTTMALVARRINFAHSKQVADVDTESSKLLISGTLTGGADAQIADRQYGEVIVVGGTALAALGLEIGTTYGTGFDEHVGAGPYAKSFTDDDLPASLEVSGSASGMTMTLAGSAT